MIYLFVGQAAKIGKTSYHGYWSGSIDLNKTYIKVNGKLWFYKPCTNYLVKDDKLVFADSGLYLAGPNTYTVQSSPTIVDGVASGFSSSDYLRLSDSFRPGSNTWEIACKVTTNSSVSDNVIYAFQAGETNATRYGLMLRTTAQNKFEATFTLNGTSWFNNTIPDFYISGNATYWTKEYWDGSAFKLDISTDGITYQNILNVESTTPIYNSFTSCKFGVWTDGAYRWAWNGSIDLNNTYIKVDGSLWFYGKNYASQNIAPVPSGYTYGNTTTSAIGFVDMRTQQFTAAPSGVTLGKDE